MVKSAAGSATYLAGLTDELFEYYLNFAKGGVEMIWMENVGALEPDPETGEITPEALEFGQRLTSAVAEYGAHMGYQWAPMGTSVAEDAMTVDQIHAIQQNGLAIARGLHQMGFEAIEMNAAGFNQGEQFLSRFYNTRTDDYGFATLENRARFVTEWIEMVKAEFGDELAVQILINCIEDQDNLDNNATLMNLDNTLTAGRNKVTTVEEGVGMASCSRPPVPTPCTCAWARWATTPASSAATTQRSTVASRAPRVTAPSTTSPSTGRASSSATTRAPACCSTW